MYVNKLGFALLSGLVLAAMTGCGNYTITFEVADIINAPGDDNTRNPLDVDILCLSKSDAEDHQDIVRGTLTADKWFGGEREKTGISAKRIYALRYGSDSDWDTRVGSPLIGARDREDGQHLVQLKIKHPQAGNGDSRIVIYAAFAGKTVDEHIAPNKPLIFPPPAWNSNILIKVGRDKIARASDE